jgi:hypothetical protein
LKLQSLFYEFFLRSAERRRFHEALLLEESIEGRAAWRRLPEVAQQVDVYCSEQEQDKVDFLDGGSLFGHGEWR